MILLLGVGRAMGSEPDLSSLDALTAPMTTALERFATGTAADEAFQPWSLRVPDGEQAARSDLGKHPERATLEVVRLEMLLADQSGEPSALIELRYRAIDHTVLAVRLHAVPVGADLGAAPPSDVPVAAIAEKLLDPGTCSALVPPVKDSDDVCRAIAGHGLVVASSGVSPAVWKLHNHGKRTSGVAYTERAADGALSVHVVPRYPRHVRIAN